MFVQLTHEINLPKSGEVVIYVNMWECQKKEQEDYDKRDEIDFKYLDKNDLKELLRIKLDEYEMLESMFSNPGEFSVDYSVIADINNYINNKTTEFPPELNYTICLNINDHKLEVYINLPLEYPQIKGDVYVKSDSLSRFQQNSLNENLKNFISKIDKGEIIVCSIIFWLQDQAFNYFNSDSNQEISEKKEQSCSSYLFHRVWIYSHHIYNKFKRRQILDMALEHKLTGFCLPGKPGIICIEGPASDCEEYWQKIKRMTWKKINCKYIEKFNIEPSVNCTRKFSDFKEIYFESGKSKSQNYHMNFGDFYNFLKENNCDYIFKELFGIDGN